jgi:uncharacterized damage-inducible protein DinB
MSISEQFIQEIREEAGPSREALKRIPTDKFDYKPHEKSMSMKQLATLNAMMFEWFRMMVAEDELDFATGGGYPELGSTDALVEHLDKCLAASVEALQRADDAEYEKIWTMRRGEQIFMQVKKGDIVRQTLRHLAHHRGQLSVYMRLNDIPVPQMYGPTADEGWG